MKEKKSSILDYAGFLSEETAEKMKKAIKESGKKSEKFNREREKYLLKLWNKKY